MDLRNQQYQIFNTQYSEKEYKEKLSHLLLQSIEKQRVDYNLFLKESGYDIHVSKTMRSENVSDSTRVFDSKNISHSNIINNCEDLRYATNFRDTKVGMDIDQWGDRLEHVYECHQIGEASSHLAFSFGIWANTSHLYYSAYCIQDVHDCFGCIGLRSARYCILNKQYTKEEYEVLVPKIIEKMKIDGEWGEFFPAKYSHFGYNQIMNMEKYPLSKDEAIAQGFTWSDYEAPFPKVAKTIP